MKTNWLTETQHCSDCEHAEGVLSMFLTDYPTALLSHVLPAALAAHKGICTDDVAITAMMANWAEEIATVPACLLFLVLGMYKWHQDSMVQAIAKKMKATMN